MALTRHSVRTCFLWKNRGEEFGPGTRQQQVVQIPCVLECRTARGVVEYAPRVARLRRVPELPRQRSIESFV